MKHSIFITGTDTGVGKTVVTGLLGRVFAEEGIKVVTQKWVQTGSLFSEEQSDKPFLSGLDRDRGGDIAVHMRTIGLEREIIGEYGIDMAPYVFKLPASPHLAASVEKRCINTARIERSFRRLERDFDIVLVEGTGGVLVPIGDEMLMVDIVKKLGLPVLIVAGNRLGAINQTLLTVEALKKRDLRIEGIIFNRLSGYCDELVLADNMRIVGSVMGEKVLGELTYSENENTLYENFLPIGKRIIQKLGCGEMRDELVRKDLKYIWHPYTQMRDSEILPPIPVKRAEGVKLYDYDGNFYYDTISSWWCNVHGHNHPVIKSAIKNQMDSVEHVLFAGFTHKPAVELAEKLVNISPRGLTRLFYSDNGSTSVEVAMKMSFQYWVNTGKKEKTCFLSLDRAYHGDTVGTMSVSGVGLFNRAFEPLFFRSYKVPAPYCYRCPFGGNRDNCNMECLEAAEDALKNNAGKISAIVIEPLLMGAGGMIVYPIEYLKGIWSLSRKYGVHLIADEVAVGFGRTGKMFACEHAGITPDFMCLSKGVTSGYLPLGATLMTEEIFDAFYDDRVPPEGVMPLPGSLDAHKTFYHGHTYTANPLACAAAAASIDLFEKEGTLKKVEEINVRLVSFLKDISVLPVAGDVRSIGAVGAIELVRDKETGEPFGPGRRIGLEVYRMGLKENLLLRPLGDVIYFFLPLCVTGDELEDIFCKAGKVIRGIVL